MSSPRLISGMQARERMLRPPMDRPRWAGLHGASARVMGRAVRITVFSTEAGISSSGFAAGWSSMQMSWDLTRATRLHDRLALAQEEQ